MMTGRDVLRIGEDERKIASKILRLLLASRWPRSAQWARAVVCLTPEGERVISRAELAEAFRGAGDPARAHEALVRHVPRGAALVWLIEDSDERAFAGLLVVDLLGGAR